MTGPRDDRPLAEYSGGASAEIDGEVIGGARAGTASAFAGSVGRGAPRVGIDALLLSITRG